MRSSSTAAIRGFDAVQRAADLVNAIASSRAQQRKAALEEVLRRHGEDDLELAGADVTALEAAAVELRAVFVAETVDRAAALLNVLLASGDTSPVLSAHDGTPWHLHLTALDADWGAWLRGSSAIPLAVLLTERGERPWGECAASECNRVFVHAGQGQTRRFCSPRCATRSRVAAHRARARSAGTA